LKLIIKEVLNGYVNYSLKNYSRQPSCYNTLARVWPHTFDTTQQCDVTGEPKVGVVPYSISDNLELGCGQSLMTVDYMLQQFNFWPSWSGRYLLVNPVRGMTQSDSTVDHERCGLWPMSPLQKHFRNFHLQTE